MSKHNNELDRFLSLNGKLPTQKDKWKAFWRIWRICQKAGGLKNPFTGFAAEDSFYCLFNDKWEWIKLATSPNDILKTPINKVPKTIRKSLISSSQKKRKCEKEIGLAHRYGINLNDENSLKVSNKLGKFGVEVHPSEVNRIRSSVCEKIRKRLEGTGWDKSKIPVSDEGILMLLYNNTILSN